MVKRILSASAICLAVAVSTCTSALAAGPATAAATAPQAGAPAVATTGAAPSMYCSPEIGVVCTVLGATVCRKYTCDLNVAAQAPAAATTSRTAAPSAPALYCAPTLQDVQCIVNEVTHPCQTRCAGTAGAAAAASPAFYCDVPVLCEVLALTVCRDNRCMVETSSMAAAPARVDSPPGDPCSRQWPWPISLICN